MAQDLTSIRTIVATVAAALLLLPGIAAANWMTSILREAGEVGGPSAGRLGKAVSELGPLGKATTYLKELTKAPEGALAAHATPEGHWEFVNRDGQRFTVGTKDEMSRVLPALAPDVAQSAKPKLTLYLSEESVFANREALDQIPSDADLFVVADNGAMPLTRVGRGDDLILTAHAKPHLALELSNQDVFEETMFRLRRPLNKSSIRTIALEPGAGKSLSAAPKFDPETKAPLVDQLDPENFVEGLGGIRGQTALVTGRLDNGRFYVTPNSGAEVAISLDDMGIAARSNDVNLVVLQSDANRQAGGRNWLWQKIEVGGLSEAVETGSFGDFLDALAARRGGFKLTTTRDSTGRVHIRAEPDVANVPIEASATNAFEDLVSHVTGEVITKAVDIDARDLSAETELDSRLIPGVPTYIQYPYLAGLIAGVAGLATARRWWLKVAPVRSTDAKPSIGTRAARLASAVIFALIFLPIVGAPAFLVQSVSHAVSTILAPFRWIRRKFLISRV